MESSKYVATVCADCQRASLVRHQPDLSLECPHCGAPRQLVPNAEYLPDEVPLFDAIERVVHRATLTPSATALIAAELEAVAERWEPPELVLGRIAPRLPGLRRCYSPRQNYGQLVLIVSTLLVIIAARLPSPAAQRNKRWHESGVRPAFRPPLDEPVSPSAKRNAS